MQGISGAGMDKATKQYRQYIFKLNHKLAKKTAKQGTVDPESGLVKFKGMLRAAAKVSRHPLSAFKSSSIFWLLQSLPHPRRSCIPCPLKRSDLCGHKRDCSVCVT